MFFNFGKNKQDNEFFYTLAFSRQRGIIYIVWIPTIYKDSTSLQWVHSVAEQRGYYPLDYVGIPNSQVQFVDNLSQIQEISYAILRENKRDFSHVEKLNLLY